MSGIEITQHQLLALMDYTEFNNYVVPDDMVIKVYCTASKEYIPIRSVNMYDDELVVVYDTYYEQLEEFSNVMMVEMYKQIPISTIRVII